MLISIVDYIHAMTSERRFNPIETVLADVVQKVDRLIGANGHIITDVSKIPDIERTVSIMAKGLIDLTTSVNKRFDLLQQDVTIVKAGQQLILQILRQKLG